MSLLNQNYFKIKFKKSAVLGTDMTVRKTSSERIANFQAKNVCLEDFEPDYLLCSAYVKVAFIRDTCYHRENVHRCNHLDIDAWRLPTLARSQVIG